MHCVVGSRDIQCRPPTNEAPPPLRYAAAQNDPASLRHDGTISTQVPRSMDHADLFGESLTVARTLIAAAVILLTIVAARATEPLEFKIGYLRTEKPRVA